MAVLCKAVLGNLEKLKPLPTEDRKKSRVTKNTVTLVEARLKLLLPTKAVVDKKQTKLTDALTKKGNRLNRQSNFSVKLCSFCLMCIIV